MLWLPVVAKISYRSVRFVLFAFNFVSILLFIYLFANYVKFSFVSKIGEFIYQIVAAVASAQLYTGESVKRMTELLRNASRTI